MLRFALLLLLVGSASAQTPSPDTGATVAQLEDSIATIQTRLEPDTLSTEARTALATRLGEMRASLEQARTVEPVVVESRQDEVPFFARPWFFALVGLLIVLAAVGAFWGARRANAPTEAPRRRSRVSSAAVPTGAERTARDVASGAPAPFASAQNLDTLRRAVQQNQEQIAALSERLGQFERQAQVASSQAAALAEAPAAPPAAAPSPVDVAAQAFVAWCRKATPLMNRVDFFEKHLQAGQPEARARTIFRDSYSQAATVRFDQQGGAAPADFWLVTIGSDTVIFPQPLNAHQFRDLAPVFEGEATPQTVREVQPARVREEGSAVVLTSPGRVT